MTDLWMDLLQRKLRYESDLAGALSVARLHGFVRVRCTSAGQWWADASKSKRKLVDLGPFATAAELIRAMELAAPSPFYAGDWPKERAPEEAKVIAALMDDPRGLTAKELAKGVPSGIPDAEELP